MKMSERMAYLAAGCFLGILGQGIFDALLPRPAQAQDKKESASKVVSCERLEIVDSKGSVSAVLTTDDTGGVLQIIQNRRIAAKLSVKTQGGALSLHDANGSPRLAVGSGVSEQGFGMVVYGDDTKPRLQAIDVGNQGVIRTLNQRNVTAQLPGTANARGDGGFRR